jgi:hypothetical protein
MTVSVHRRFLPLSQEPRDRAHGVMDEIIKETMRRGSPSAASPLPPYPLPPAAAIAPAPRTPVPHEMDYRTILAHR